MSEILWSVEVADPGKPKTRWTLIVLRRVKPYETWIEMHFGAQHVVLSLTGAARLGAQLVAAASRDGVSVGSGRK